MADPADMIVPMLREIHAELAAFWGETKERFDLLEPRFTSLDSAQASFRHALGPDSLLSKLVTGEFEERIGVLESKVRELESTR